MVEFTKVHWGRVGLVGFWIGVVALLLLSALLGALLGGARRSQEEPRIREILLVFGTTFYEEDRTDRTDEVNHCSFVGSSEHRNYDSLTVTASYNRSRSDDADGIIYYGPDTAARGMPPFGNFSTCGANTGGCTEVRQLNHDNPKDNIRVNLWYSEEPPWSQNAFGELNDAMRHFSVFLGFHPGTGLAREGTVCYNGWGLNQWPYQGWDQNVGPGEYWPRAVLNFSSRRSDFDSVWAQKNCQPGDTDGAGMSHRTELVRILSSTGRVARIGECLNNLNFSAEDKGFLTESIDSIGRFKFLLAFENNLCDFYMSEKIWKAYGLGMVPVVYASAVAAQSLPAEDSFINARDFSTAIELRDFLATVANDEGRYMQYFDWKTRPLENLNRAFQHLFRARHLSHIVRVPTAIPPAH